VPSSENLSIFFNSGWPVPKNDVRGRYFSEIEFRQGHNYVLFNCDEFKPFIQWVCYLNFVINWLFPFCNITNYTS
jgi:hypothetical protein